MAMGIEPPTFRLGIRLRKNVRHPNHSARGHHILLYTSKFSRVDISLDKMCGETELPSHQNPPLGLTGMSQRMMAGAVREVLSTTVDCL